MEEVKRILEALSAPAVRYYPQLDPDKEPFCGIRAIGWDGLEYMGKKTPIFAYLGLPAGASAECPVPGVVLIHGGGGHPMLQWVKLWNDRGYAALALETTGAWPTARNAGDTDVSPLYTRDFTPPEGYIAAPDKDNMQNDGAPLGEQWMTHALAEVWLANSLLRGLPEVDEERVGVCGISWGGVITSLSIAVDPRWAFAIPIYGVGYMIRSLSYMGYYWRRPGNVRHFRAEDGYPDVRMPVLWLSWNRDIVFAPPSHSASYEATAGGNPLTSLSWIDKMGHSSPCGWKPEIQYLFADAAVRGGEPFARFETQPDEERAEAKLRVPPATRVTGARIFSLDGPIPWLRQPDDRPRGVGQEYRIGGASFADGVVSAAIPPDARSYYLEVSFENGAGKAYTLTSRWVERDA